MEASVRTGGQKNTQPTICRWYHHASRKQGKKVELAERVENVSESAGFKLNIKKNTEMSTGEHVKITVNGEEITTVSSNKFLEAVITNGSCTKRTISLGKAGMANMTYVTKASGVSTNSPVKLVQTTDFPAVLYGCEWWTLRKTNRRQIYAFELWTWRRLFRIS